MVKRNAKLKTLDNVLSLALSIFNIASLITIILTGGDICAEDLATVSCQSQNSMIK